jgi:hypothetical protein
LSFANSGAQSIERTRVALVGHVCMDHNVIDGVPQPTSWGSSVLFARDYLSGMPAVDTAVIAPYGDDFARLWPQIEIANRPTAPRTLVYENISEDETTTRRCEYTENSRPVALDSHLRGILASAQVVLVAPLLPNFCDRHIAELRAAADPSATFVLLAQGYLRRVGEGGIVERRGFAESADILGFFDVVIVADDDIAPAWAEAESEAARWSRELPAVKVIVTRNARGAVLFEDGVATEFATEPVTHTPQMSSVGAGDTFGAAVALAYAAKNDIGAAIRAGNAAAGRFLLRREDAESGAA